MKEICFCYKYRHLHKSFLVQFDEQRVNTFEGCKYSALKDHCIEIKKSNYDI